jgi:hypothetical protein
MTQQLKESFCSECKEPIVVIRITDTQKCNTCRMNMQLKNIRLRKQLREKKFSRID